MKTTIATLGALAVLAALPTGASARPDLPGTCDLLKNTFCDPTNPPDPLFCTYVPDLDGHLYGPVCIRLN